MRIRIAEELKEMLQNLTGKDISSEPVGIAEVLREYNALYVCKVTFSVTPEDAEVVVKSGNKVISKNYDGTYHLKEGSYTYTVTAAGYTGKSDQALTITNADETAGTKTVNVTLTTCIVTFSKTPAGATIVVKKGAETVQPNLDGTYNLPAGSYTYDATAEGYIAQENQALIITSVDETAGTKTVNVTLESLTPTSLTPFSIGDTVSRVKADTSLNIDEMLASLDYGDNGEDPVHLVGCQIDTGGKIEDDGIITAMHKNLTGYQIIVRLNDEEVVVYATIAEGDATVVGWQNLDANGEIAVDTNVVTSLYGDGEGWNGIVVGNATVDEPVI